MNYFHKIAGKCLLYNKNQLSPFSKIPNLVPVKREPMASWLKMFCKA